MLTVKDYYNHIILIKEGKSELNELQPYNDNGVKLMDDLNSGSKVAIWRLWVWIMATLSWMQNAAMLKHKKEVESQIENQRHGTTKYYHAKSLDFQLGHALFWNGHQYVYLNADESAQIIKRSAVGMHLGVLRFKVTKEINGELEPLTSSEKTAFSDYLLDILYPGTNYSVISTQADELKLDLNVYVDHQVINADGENVITGEYIVENAINRYIENLPFNGRMAIQKLIDEIQEVEGVKDLELLNAYSKYGSLPWTSFNRQIEPFSGYMKLNINVSNIDYYEYV